MMGKKKITFDICPKLLGIVFPNLFLGMKIFSECPNILGRNENYLQHL